MILPKKLTRTSPRFDRSKSRIELPRRGRLRATHTSPVLEPKARNELPRKSTHSSGDLPKSGAGFIQALGRFAAPVAAVMLGALSMTGCAPTSGTVLSGSPRMEARDLSVNIKVVPMDQTAHSERLLKGSKTIRESGCLLCSMAMTATAITGNRQLDPPRANKLISARRGAYSGSALEVPVAARVLGLRQEARRSVRTSNIDSTVRTIEASLRAGRPVVVGVDLRSGQASSGFSGADHFITITGLTKDGAFIAVDPLGGRFVLLEKKGGALHYGSGSGKVSEMILFRSAA